MNKPLIIFWLTILRIVLGIACIILGVLSMISGLVIRGAMDVFAGGLALPLTGSILTAGPLARLIARPAGNLFFPSEKLRGPQPLYGIAETKRKKGLTQEAFDDFQKMAEKYPQEMKPYIGMIDIAVTDLKNADLANSVYQHGLKTLKKEKDRETLTRLHKTISSQLTLPKEQRPIIIRNSSD